MKHRRRETEKPQRIGKHSDTRRWQKRQHNLAVDCCARDQCAAGSHRRDARHPAWLAALREHTRSVAVVLDNLAVGVSAEELHADYPTLPKEAIPTALAYAADLAPDAIVPIPAAMVHE